MEKKPVFGMNAFKNCISCTVRHICVSISKITEEHREKNINKISIYK